MHFSFACFRVFLLEELRHLPGSVQHAFNLEPQIHTWADRFAKKDYALAEN